MATNRLPWSECKFQHSIPAFYHIATCTEPPKVWHSLVHCFIPGYPGIAGAARLMLMEAGGFRNHCLQYQQFVASAKGRTVFSAFSSAKLLTSNLVPYEIRCPINTVLLAPLSVVRT